MRTVEREKGIWVFVMICVFWGDVSCGNANSNAVAQVHSKDSKSFPRNSAKTVLTAFVEADLGDFNNRQNDDRYPLWWGLTERGGAPEDDGVKLFIQSYKITENTTKKKIRDMILNLEMDVRAFWLSGDPKISGASRRDVNVVVAGSMYSLGESNFFEAVLGKGGNAVILHRNKADYYYVPKDKRKWVFPVRMIKVKGKWVIATGSVPPEAFYGNKLLDLYSCEINKRRKINEICAGRRPFDTKIMESYRYLQSPTGSNESRFRSQFCGETDIRIREESVDKFVEKMGVLERVFVE